MKANEVFPSHYLKAGDLGTSKPVVVISGVRSDKLGEDERRILKFRGKEKELVLNRTNWNMIAEITGQDDDENWVGHAIQLYATRVDMQGKRVDAIRVDYPPKGSQPAPPPPPPVEADEDESVPF